MKKFRKKINKIDKKIIRLLAERIWLMKPIAEYKLKNNLEIHQPEREKKIINEQKKLAKEFNINPEFIEKIFKLTIEECTHIQKEIIN